MRVWAVSGTEMLELKVQADEGLGPAPVRRLSEQGPMQHGETDVGYRLQPRIFSLLIVVAAKSKSGLAQRRDTLLRILSPHRNPALLFELDNGEKRQIDCHLIDAPMGYDARRDWSVQKLGLQFRAPDPTFYNPTSKTVVFGLGGGGDEGLVPTPIPMHVGASSLDQVRSIAYPGSFLSLPWQVKICGPITNPRMENLDTGEKLDFTGRTLALGEFYELDLRYGRKSVIDHSGNFVKSHLTEDSDLVSFHLTPHPDAYRGVNNIKVTGSAITQDTEVYLSYYDRFVGI